jgi:hypothetical protein
MKEFDYTFSKGLREGMRKRSTNPLNNEALTLLYNGQVTEDGVSAYATKDIINADLTVSWPYPQLFLGSKYAFATNATGVYKIPIGSLATSLSVTDELPMLDELGSSLLDDLSEALTWTEAEGIEDLTAGDPWDFVDFGEYCLLTNGAVMVIIDNVTVPAEPRLASLASSSVLPRCKTFCNYKGQLIGGNVQSDWHDCDSSSIVWGKIGSVDLTPTNSGEAGYKVITEFSGVVHKVKTLGDIVIVYGANGIVMMKPEGVVFGFKQISSNGIPSITAVGGNDREHVCIDNRYRLWRLNEKQMEKLDYSEELSNLTLSDTVISYDPELDEYYISDGSLGFLLTRHGFSKIYQYASSVITLDGTTYIAGANGSDTSFILETDTLDFGVRGDKTVVAVEVGMPGDLAMSVKMAWGSKDFRFDYTFGFILTEDDGFIYAPSVLCNPNGIAYPRVTADKHRVRLTADSFTNVQIDYINIRFNYTDKRALRGRINVN